MTALAAVVAVEEPMTQLNLAALQQLIESTDEKHDEAHQRLRHDFRELKAQLDAGLNSVRADHAQTQTHIATMQATPVDAMKLMLPTRVVVAIVAGAVGIAGSIWISTSGLKADVRDILGQLERQKTAVEASSKLQEIQAASPKTAIDDMKRRQELQQYEIQSLKEAIIGKARLP